MNELSLDELSNHELHAAFVSAWEALQTAANVCRSAVLADTTLPAWIYGHEQRHDGRAATAELIVRFTYDDDQAGRESRILPGVLGSSARTLRAAERLNSRKDRVRRVLQALDRRKIQGPARTRGPRTRVKLSERVLRQEGLARLHRMQLYRHLKTVAVRPDRMGLSWAHTRRVHRLTVAEVRTRLEARLAGGRSDKRTADDIERLSRLPMREPLALVEMEPLHARVNLGWRQDRPAGWARRQMTIALPLLFPSEPAAALPETTPLMPPDEAGPRRLRLRSRRLEPAPCLATLRAYRYRSSR